MGQRGRPRKNKPIEPIDETNLEKTEIVSNDLVKENNNQISQEQEERNKITQDKLKRAKEVMRKLNKDGGGKVIINFANTVAIRERQSFGYKYLDELTNGGIPRGLFSTIWGSKGCGKTTVALKMAATAQKEGKVVAWIDAEHSFDNEWAKEFGINLETLIYERTETAEQSLDTIIKLCKEKICDLIVLDSIHSLCPRGQLYEGKGEIEKSLVKDTQALRARKLTQFFEMSIHPVSEAKCAILLIAQSRISLGEIVKIETLTGGHALLHNSRIIIKFRRGQGVDAPGEEIITDEQATDKEGNLKFNKKGEPIYIKDKIILGFDLVANINKSQVQGCVERQEVHVPFLFASGIDETEHKPKEE